MTSRFRALPAGLLSSVRNLVEGESGIVLNDAKLPHLSALIRERMKALALPDAREYLSLVSEGPAPRAERRKLVDGLLVGETSFFRTPGLYRVFEKRILADQVDRGVVPPIPVWSAGCSTGEEAYSVAMAALEWKGERHGPPVRVLATDIHRGALDRAREGVYPPQALRDVPERLRAKYFEPAAGGRFRVIDAVRRLVLFEERNLVEDLSMPLPPGKYAAIFCRNVMIYFRAGTTRRLVERFHDRLLGGGVFFLGPSETLWGISDAFALEEREAVFYYRKPAASSRCGKAGRLR